MQSQDYRWFLENYDELFKKFGKVFLAIKNKEVIGTFGSYREAVNETKKKEEVGTFIVQECNGSESAYTNYISSVNIA